MLSGLLANQRLGMSGLRREGPIGSADERVKSLKSAFPRDVIRHCIMLDHVCAEVSEIIQVTVTIFFYFDKILKIKVLGPKNVNF